ncbi:MAG: hypothetical protein RLZZ70_722 [Candidatus Parcubacteria bacterium]|jgi:hypothetical protein
MLGDKVQALLADKEKVLLFLVLGDMLGQGNMCLMAQHNLDPTANQSAVGFFFFKMGLNQNLILV